MATGTGIEWTDATWNPVTGCTRVSKGCDNCYAATLAGRLLRAAYLARPPVVDSDLTRSDPFAVRIWPERLGQPEKWREPRMIFVNSMSDLFHADVPTAFARQIFRTMLRANWHTYQVLTKRPARALRFWKDNRDLFEGGGISGAHLAWSIGRGSVGWPPGSPPTQRSRHGSLPFLRAPDWPLET